MLEKIKTAVHPDFPGYEVTENGEVYSKLYPGLVDGEVYKVSSHVNKIGYVNYNIKHIDGKRRHVSAHRLVAECFIQNPDNLSDVNHKDLDKQNNHVENLEWVSHSDNMKHAAKDNSKWNQKLTEEQEIVRRYIRGEKQTKLAEEFGVSQAKVHKEVKKRGSSKKRKVVENWQVEEIRVRYAAGDKVVSITGDLRLNYQTVNAIAKGLRR